MFEILSALLFSADVSRLGHSDYRTRERAEAGLHAAGWPAEPALRRGLLSPCPETRERCRRLLVPHDCRRLRLAAVWCVVGPEPDPRAVYADPLLRQYLDRLAAICELDTPGFRRDPGILESWRRGLLPWALCGQEVARLRSWVTDPSEDDPCP